MSYPFKLDRGKLHRRLNIPEGKKIPLSTIRASLVKAKADKDMTLEREDQFALNAAHFHHHK